MAVVWRSSGAKKAKAKREVRELPSVDGLINEVLELRTMKRDFFRPSMLYGCDRANYFHYTCAPSHPSRPTPKLSKILDNGTAVHEVVQGYLRDHPEWWFAAESRVNAQIEGLNLRGSCDGVLIRRSDLYRFSVEIKTISTNQFIKLTKAKPGHVSQALTYASQHGLDATKIVYWDKNTHDIKEYDHFVTPAVKRGLKERVRHLKVYVEKGKLPEFDFDQCSPELCTYYDLCRSKGGKPHLASKGW